MGEEKPDEELMGKRKPSPRLSTTSLDADIFRITRFLKIIHRFSNLERLWYDDEKVGKLSYGHLRKESGHEGYIWNCKRQDAEGGAG